MMAENKNFNKIMQQRQDKRDQAINKEYVDHIEHSQSFSEVGNLFTSWTEERGLDQIAKQSEAPQKLNETLGLTDEQPLAENLKFNTQQQAAEDYLDIESLRLPPGFLGNLGRIMIMGLERNSKKHEDDIMVIGNLGRVIRRRGPRYTRGFKFQDKTPKTYSDDSELRPITGRQKRIAKKLQKKQDKLKLKTRQSVHLTSTYPGIEEVKGTGALSNPFRNYTGERLSKHEKHIVAKSARKYGRDRKKIERLSSSMNSTVIEQINSSRQKLSRNKRLQRKIADKLLSRKKKQDN